MPRIREVKAQAFNTTQDPDSMESIRITGDAEEDFSRAVELDYAGHCSDSDMPSSDIYQAWEHVSGIVAAGMLSGATECAHVDAVRCAYLFNSRPLFYVMSGDDGTAEPDPGDASRPWELSYADALDVAQDRESIGWKCSVVFARRDLSALARYEDPYSDAEWGEWHQQHGTTCAECQAVNYDVGDDDTCANCLAPMADGYPAGADASELDDLIKGYVTALTWTDLERHPDCPECGEPLTNWWDEDSESERWDCRHNVDHGDQTEDARRQVESGSNRGSHPEQYGVEDLEPDALREIRSDCAGFLRECLTDLREYVEVRSYDPSEGSVWEYVGHDFYFSAAGHGTGFWDRGTGELGDRLHAASEPYSVPDLTLDPSTGKISS
jgi:hypothetical protein